MKKFLKLFTMALLIIPCALMLFGCENGKLSDVVAYGWYDIAGPAATTYNISTPTQLVEFGDIISGLNNRAVDTFAGKTVKLANDIDISSIADWRPIGGTVTFTKTEQSTSYNKIDITIEDAKTFQGTFDGNGHAINGLTITKKDAKYGAFFVATKDAEIKNINFTNVNMVLNETATFERGCDYATVVGIAKNTKLTNITVGGKIQSTRVAGIAYTVTDGTKLTNCVSSLNLISKSRTFTDPAKKMNIISGGLVGQIAIENAATIDNKATDEREIFLNCKFNGTLTVDIANVAPSFVWVGQLLGSTSYPSAPATNGYYTLVVSGFKAEGKLIVTDEATLRAITSMPTVFNGFNETNGVVDINTPNDHIDAQSKLGRIHKNLAIIVK